MELWQTYLIIAVLFLVQLNSSNCVMSSWAVSRILGVVNDLTVFEDGRHMSMDDLDSFIISLELVYRDILAQEIISSVPSDLNRACLMVQNSLLYLSSMRDSQYATSSQSPNIFPLQTSDGMGRPRYLISYEQLRFLVENHFSVPQIANMLHVSVRTIFRRMSTFSLSIRSQYSRINDQELDFIVSEIQREFPNCGNRQMHGHLISHGL